VIDAAEVIARAVHIDVVRSGTRLFAADGRYQYDVAAACSGVRSLMALAALSLLVGYLNFRTTWRRALVFALCFPLTYLGNVARIAAIIFAAQLGGQTWGERAHDVMGFGVFVIVLGGVLAAARWLERIAPETRPRGECHLLSDKGSCAPSIPAGAESAEAARRVCHLLGDKGPGAVAAPGSRPEQTRGRRCHVSSDKTAGGGAAAAVVMMAVAEMFFLTQLAARPGDGAAGVRLAADGLNPVELPAFVGTEWIGRRAEVTAVEREILPPDTGFSRRNYVQVQGGGHAVFVSIVLSGRDRSAIHRPELCLVGQGWTIAEEGERSFRLGESFSIPATLLRTVRVDPRTGGRVPSIVAYWFVSSEAVEPSHWRRVLRDAWSRVRRGRADRWAYVLVQADAADGETAALARMEEVLRATVPAFQWVH
jgi:EpsI family protein